MSDRFTESDVEEAAIHWFQELGYAYASGPELLPDGLTPERDERTPFLEARLRAALTRLNPGLPDSAVEDAFRRLARVSTPSVIAANRELHRMVVDDVSVEYKRADSSIAGAQARVVDFDDPDANDWLVVNQLTVIDDEHHRRPDVAVYINGLPHAVIDLKNPADPKADWLSAFKRLQTCHSREKKAVRGVGGHSASSSPQPTGCSWGIRRWTEQHGYARRAACRAFLRVSCLRAARRA